MIVSKHLVEHTVAYLIDLTKYSILEYFWCYVSRRASQPAETEWYLCATGETEVSYLDG